MAVFSAVAVVGEIWTTTELTSLVTGTSVLDAAPTEDKDTSTCAELEGSSD